MPDAAAARAALDAILASKAFRDSPQLKAFLTYVVNETLAGRASELKGYSIATMALGKPESFDPQTDPIVRVQAGRLRQALAEYEAEAPDAPLLIRLERGSYAAVFVRREEGVPERPTMVQSEPAPQIAAANVGPRASALQGSRRWLLTIGAVALAAGAAGGWLLRHRTVIQSLPQPAQSVRQPPPPETYFPTLIVEADPASTQPGMSAIAARLRDAISRFDDLVVVAETEATDMTSAVKPSHLDRLGRDLLLKVKGDALAGDAVRVSARLLDRRDNRVIWSREYDPFPGGAGGEQQRTAVIRSMTSTLAQPYGVIHAYVRANIGRPLITHDPYNCIIAGLDYWLATDRKAHAEARSCLLEKLDTHPTFGALHAQLAYLHLEEYRHGYNPMQGDARARATESARRAVQYRPASARAHQALLAALFAAGDMEGAWRAAADALRLNPADTEIMADVGSYHAISGNFEKALELLNSAIEHNPSPPAWVLAHRALALYMLGRLDQSGPAARALDGSSYPLAMMALVMQAAQFRDREAGIRHRDRFREAHPSIAADPTSFLARANYNSEVAARLVFDYNRALRWIEEQP